MHVRTQVQMSGVRAGYRALAIVAVCCLARVEVHAQKAPLIGLGLVRGSIQTPYFHECSGTGRTDAAGMIGYFGLEVSDVSLVAEYTSVGETGSDGICSLPDALPNGSHEVRAYPRRSSHIWAWSVNARYRIPTLPALTYVGFGSESEGNEFVVFGAELRTRGALAVFVGAQASHLRTPFVTNEEEWQNGHRVASIAQVGQGHTWRKVVVLRAGLEYAWRIVD